MSPKRRPKTGKALRQSRKADSLSDPVKEMGGYTQAEHLGNKAKHDVDALRQEAWIRQQKAAKLGVTADDLDESKELSITASRVGFTGSDRDEAVIKEAEWDEEKLKNDVLGEKGLVISMANIGNPGSRKWKDLEGGAWVSAMLCEKKIRANYVNASRVKTANGPKPLQVILARVAPWVGSTAGTTLLDHPLGLKDRLLRICNEFSDRYNVDVVGAVVHRESDYDLHIHLVFSQTRERVSPPKKKGVRKTRREHQEIRAKIKAELRGRDEPATNQAVSVIFKRMEEDGSLSKSLSSAGVKESVRYERIKDPNSTVRRSTLGHAFLCKMMTWRAADAADKESVAAFRDRPIDDPHFERSFRSRFARAESHGELLEDLWWNLWLTQRWTDLCLEGLDPEIARNSEKKGHEMGKSYLQYGSTVPTLAERLAVDKQRLQKALLEQAETIAELESQKEDEVGALSGNVKEIARLKTEATAIKAERDSNARQLRQLNSELSHVAVMLKPKPGESVAAAASRVAAASVTDDVSRIAQAVLEKMDKSESKEKWHKGGSRADQAVAFLDWLEGEPARLLEKFKKLVKPIVPTIKNWPPAKELLRYLQFGKSKINDIDVQL